MEGGVTYFALRCFSCQMFQVNRKTKSGKWKCSVCGEGQSVVKTWGRGGRAKDLRGLVMELNAAAGRGEDLTATLRKAAASTSTTSPPPPLHPATRNGHNHAASFPALSRDPQPLSRDPQPLSRDRDLHTRAASLLLGGGGGDGTALLQARRFPEGVAEADPVDNRQARFDDPRFDEPEPRFDEQRFDEPRLDEQRFDKNRCAEQRFNEPRFDEPRFDEPAPLGFTSGRDRRDRDMFDALGARAAGDRLHGGTRSTGEGEHVWHELRNAENTDNALSGATARMDYRARESVGIDSFGEQIHTPRQSALEATGGGSKASRWRAFAVASSRDGGIDSLEKHRRGGQTVFGQQMEGDPNFVTSLPETYAALSTKRRGSPTNGKGRKRASSSTSSSAGSQANPPEIAPAGSRSPWKANKPREMQRAMDPPLSEENRQKSGRHEGQQDAPYGRWGGGGESSGGSSSGRVSSSSNRVFVGELNKNARYSGSRVSGVNGSAGVEGGKVKAKSSRWGKFV